MRVVEKIVIKGAREHNLKDFDLEIPRKKLVVVTGVSGSGKSSLAFDTIYAEGQRRYVESLSVYVRQFLEQMDKPDVESIEGLSPAISIEQKTTSHNPRSTVGTVTEVYNYLRLLFSRIGKPYCPNCGKTIASQSMQQMVDRVLGLPAGSRIELMSPIVRNRKGEYRKNIEGLIRDGYTRIKVNGMVVDLEREDITLDKRKKHTIEVVVDRLIVRDGITSRLADSMEVAGRLSNGIIKVECQDGAELIFNERLACVECGTGYEEITPAFFSFNSPEGACPECKGLGEKFHLDPELVVPDKDISLEHGAIAPWSKRSGRFKQILNTLSEEYGFSLSLPFKKLPVDIQDIIFNGSAGRRIDFAYARGGKKYVFTEEFEGVLSNLERCYREAVSHEEKAELHRYMNPQPCPVCKGSRLKKEALFIKVNGRSIHDIASMSANEALIFFKRLELSKTEETVAQRILKEIEERLGFLLNVGLDYISLSRPAGTLSGGEGQRIRLATQIGSNLAGVLYILDEPTIGLHQRDNRRLIKALKKLVDMGNTVIVVEHDEETIRSADFVVDMGPGAGEHGGEIIALGTASEIMQNPLSLTGRYLSGDLKIPVPKERKKPQKKFLTIKGASANNLKDIEARFPIGLMTCVTGVSGSGKSTLVVDTLYKNLARALYGSKDKAGHVASISGIEH
ncbi:MAG: excinuclease ABC subunit UvrA, partial [Deltaproteobacteria bacterium]|nr:excinuclease ABC subunit UvrA [Deltaproteobacteria bacterium]